MRAAWREAVLYLRLAQLHLCIIANERRRDKAIDDLSKAIAARDQAMSDLRIHFHDGPIVIERDDVSKRNKYPVRQVPVRVK